MKQILYSLTIFSIFFTACKKEDVFKPSNPTVYSEPDFALIPTKNAKWYIHTQGNYYDWYDDLWFFNVSPGLAPSEIDTAAHIYTTIEALNRDTNMYGYNFHVYSFKRKFVHNIDTTGVAFMNKHYCGPYNFYLFEDTLSKKVYNGYSPYFKEFYELLDFSDKAPTRLKPCKAWPEMNIFEDGGYNVGGHKLKSWSMQNTYDSKYKYFYKAIGIGSITGILPFHIVADDWGQVRSLDFVYKGDSIHFDYPLH